MGEPASRSYGGDEEEQALLERMAKREERRQRRMKEALERQSQPEPQGGEKNSMEEDRLSSWRRARYRDSEEAEEKTDTYDTAREEMGPEEVREEEAATPAGGGQTEECTELEEEEEQQQQKVEAVEDGSRGSCRRGQVKER